MYKAKYEEVTERLQREISPGPAQVPRNAGHHPDTQGGLPGPPDLRRLCLPVSLLGQAEVASLSQGRY